MTTTRAQDTGALDVTELVRRAAAGESRAWERLVDQYSRLIWAITRDFKLVESDAADVAQVTWLRLLENIHKIENPDRVGSWLASTARNECLRCLANRKRVVLAEDEDVLQGAAPQEPEIDEGLLLAERSQMVQEAMSHLPWRWQRMLELLMADPPVPYAEISDQLGLPVGSIGPTRSRCLARLRVLLHSSLPRYPGHEDGGRRREAASVKDAERVVTVSRSGSGGRSRSSPVR
jgi:RNA polymerase sigma factor (sigma-70 family)